MADQEFKQIATEALELAHDESSKEVIKEIKASEAEVKASARVVVEYADRLKGEWITAQNIAKSLGPDEDPATKVYKFQKKMIKSREEFKDIMKYVLDLQNKVNSFLGQKIQMVYTFIGKDGTVEVYKFENDIEHMKVGQASSKKGGVITGRIGFSKKALTTMEKMTAAQGFNQASLDATFKEVHERALISKAKAKMNGAFYIFWNEGNGWKGSRVTSMGAIGEAYFNFFINEYTFSSFMEAAVGDYMTNKNYGVEVGDSASGFLQGDVSKNGIEYGVKASGASAMGYAEIIDYARQIMNTTDLLTYLTGDGTTEGLKDTLRNSASVNLAREVLAEELDSVIAKEILDALNQKGKGNINIPLKL